MDKAQQLITSFAAEYEGLDFSPSQDMTNYSTMKIQSCADLITVRTVESLRELLRFLSVNKLRYKALGWGANQLIRTSPDFVYLKLSLPFERSTLEKVRPSYILPASVSLAVLTAAASRLGLNGWEVFTGVPASLGGAIYMNAGTNLGEIGRLVKSVKAFSATGEEKNFELNDSDFSYRKNNFLGSGDIIYQAELRHFGIDPMVSTKISDYLKLRNKTQPLKEKTCGCMFKNFISDKMTCRAGQSIDIMGLKGFSYRGTQISHKHANFMINRDSATYEDVYKGIEFIQNQLYLHYGIKFDVEFEL